METEVTRALNVGMNNNYVVGSHVGKYVNHINISIFPCWTFWTIIRKFMLPYVSDGIQTLNSSTGV